MKVSLRRSELWYQRLMFMFLDLERHCDRRRAARGQGQLGFGRQSVRVTLPDFAPGSILVLRTDPGPYGDTAWDWVYLASLKLHREPAAP